MRIKIMYVQTVEIVYVRFTNLLPVVGEINLRFTLVWYKFQIFFSRTSLKGKNKKQTTRFCKHFSYGEIIKR